jgi:hypothetical protein
MRRVVLLRRRQLEAFVLVRHLVLVSVVVQLRQDRSNCNVESLYTAEGWGGAIPPVY